MLLARVIRSVWTRFTNTENTCCLFNYVHPNHQSKNRWRQCFRFATLPAHTIHIKPFFENKKVSLILFIRIIRNETLCGIFSNLLYSTRRTHTIQMKQFFRKENIKYCWLCSAEISEKIPLAVGLEMFIPEMAFYTTQIKRVFKTETTSKPSFWLQCAHQYIDAQWPWCTYTACPCCSHGKFHLFIISSKYSTYKWSSVSIQW